MKVSSAVHWSLTIPLLVEATVGERTISISRTVSSPAALIIDILKGVSVVMAPEALSIPVGAGAAAAAAAAKGARKATVAPRARRDAGVPNFMVLQGESFSFFFLYLWWNVRVGDERSESKKCLLCL